MRGDRTSSITNGPSLFGDSFLERLGVLRFVASSQTLSPVLKGVNFREACQVICSLASSCAANASFRKFSSSRSLEDSEGMSDWVIRGGMAFGTKP